jgi:hypothetical protein
VFFSSKIKSKNKTSSAHLSNPKKRLVFFVLLAVLVFGSSLFVFSYHCSAAYQFKPGEREQLLTPPWSLSNQQIDALANKDTSFSTILVDAAKQDPEVQKNMDTVSASLNQFSGKAVLQGAADALSGIVLGVVIGVLAVIAAFCKSFVEFGAQVLDFTLNPSLYNFTSNTMIVQGWVMVRDICNLFFLLVLLFIAMCTILKIEKYHAKKTLLMLIIMALLINFSKPIAIFIFDGSQLLMNFFLSQMGQTGTGQTTSTVVAKAAEIADLVYKALPGYWGSDQTSLNIAVQYLFAVVFLFMLGVAFFVTALMLIIRIVVIMLLIIVSPFAFFAAIVPDFSKMSSSWWSSLFEYSYYGPAAAFFLLLATKLDSVLPHLTTSTSASGMASLGTTVNNIAHYLTVLVFLYASIFMAKKFGGGAGAAIVGNANKFMKWAGKGSYRAPAWASRAFGVTGATSQKMQQSRWTRWATKQGRADSQEEWEAKVGEKIGVRGAMEKQVQKRAKKYKDEHYTEAALKTMAAKGDAAAAFRLAEDGDMDATTYAALQNNKNYSGNVKKMVDKKLKKKQLHIFVAGQLENFIAEQKKAGTYINDISAKYDLAEQEFGKLSPADWKEQDWAAVGSDMQLSSAASNVYSGMNDRNKQKVTDDMTGAKYAAGSGVIW